MIYTKRGHWYYESLEGVKKKFRTESEARAALLEDAGPEVEYAVMPKLDDPEFQLGRSWDAGLVNK